MKIKKLYALLLLMPFALVNIQAQQRPGALGGIVYAKSSDEVVPFAKIALFPVGKTELNAGVSSDIDGKYSIKPLKPGFYRLECTFTGFAELVVDSIQITSSLVSSQNLYLREETAMLKEVVISYEAPLIDATKSSKITRQEDLQSMAVRDISSISSQAVGVSQNGSGQSSIRGSRSEGRVYFIDGVRVGGSVQLEHQNGEALGREEYAKISENSFLRTEVKPLSTFSSDVDVASYANVRRYLQDGYLPPADAVRIEEMLNYFSYSPLSVEEGKAFAVNQALVECPWEKDHQLLRISINTEKLAKEDTIGNDVDDLKYQTSEASHAFADELATVKIRHKKPSGTSSVLEEHIVKNEMQTISPDLSFMASVASFGMLLRDSPHKGLSDYPLVLSLAQTGLKAENVDYRSEFVRLVELANELNE